jgi:hypothetical protein
MKTLYVAIDVGVNLGYVSYITVGNASNKGTVLTPTTMFIPKDASQPFQQSRLGLYHETLTKAFMRDTHDANQRLGGVAYERVLLLEDVTMVARNSRMFTKDWWVQLAIYTLTLVVANEHGFKVKTLTPKEIKKRFVGDGKASKVDMRQQYDSVQAGLGWPLFTGGVGKHEHVVDAFALLWCFLNEVQQT